jgi:hypothetical protein
MRLRFRHAFNSVPVIVRLHNDRRFIALDVSGPPIEFQSALIDSQSIEAL